MTSKFNGHSGEEGVALFRSLLADPPLANWTAQIETRYEVLEAARREGGAVAVHQSVPTGERFMPTASSLTVGAIFSGDHLRELLAEISAGAAGEWIMAELGTRVACDLDQAWVRRQYAPGNYPPLHAPHGWHQDGALRFDYLSHPDGIFPPDALLPMVTCWIALGLCGDVAPGLELVARRFDGLLAPAELTEERVRPRFAPEYFSRPVMAPGDALLFRGDILHRTYVAPNMTKDRTSIELRFFPEDNYPVRLKEDRFLPLVCSGG